MAKIHINGMKFYAYHGCFKEERTIGTYFLLNCTLEVNCTTAAITDNLNETINYQTVYQLIAEQMKQPSALLEHVAYRIIKTIKTTFPQVKNIIVEVKKLNPPLGGQMESVSVEMNSIDFE